jgi:hypothetical protein
MRLMQPPGFPSGHTDVSAFSAALCVLQASDGSRTPRWRRLRSVSPSPSHAEGAFFQLSKWNNHAQ